MNDAPAPAPAKIMFTTGFARRYTAGQREFDIPAKNLRDVIYAMEEKFPGLAETLAEETTIAVDGELYEIVYTHPIKPGAEVFFIPKIEGG